ncbi:D-lyxose/D-mannose family sugar isomerase [Coprobacter secundus]|uniref:D-lyxose/D-mannose family sugar isomerase n=1 Tax=Coprobacter secundus TaxID=1501392 RepID=UPI000573A68F|nr:D-lyxose/D-mannose family sugar isomerase [Coprobacter secundus]KHM47518.1 sugar ABC transporter [Coprobacter secundus]
MKRSEVNRYIKQAIKLFDENNFHLPSWALLTPEEWKDKIATECCKEIIDHTLGWDVTDFGKNNFMKEGLTLFTLRNGSPKSEKTYCEKIMVSYVNQITPMHFHWNKMEDIINRGGGILALQLWKANIKEEKTSDSFTVQIDGITRKIEAGEIIRLNPGESITLEPYIYHQFWAEKKTCIIGEVSKVNDDSNDNRFYEPLGRYPKIEEDESALFLLCTEYL